jgi:hypothetical protein
MRAFLVRIVMPGGSQGLHTGLYAHGFDAAIRALDLFPQASSVAVIRQPNKQTQPMNYEIPNPTAPVANIKPTSRPLYRCEELGVCQGLDLVCTQCKTFAKNPAHDFAPGVITADPEGLLPGDKSQSRELVRFLLISVAITVGTMLVAGVAGYLWAVAK